jgi:hypothetical protein
MSAHSIPITFPEHRICVSEAEAIERLGLNDGRSVRAQKKAFKEFRDKHNIPAEPGFVFSVKKIEAACGA